MAIWLRFVVIGYGAGILAGLSVGLSLSDPVAARMLGWLTAWIGGAALSLGVAYCWSRSGASKKVAQLSETVEAFTVAEDLVSDLPQDENEAWMWAADLMAERFEADLASDREAETVRKAGEEPEPRKSKTG
ncbi:MAG: hypothetical protein AAGF44_04000 [Pseudomonadota bacterium]